MRIITKLIKVSNYDYYVKHLEFLNVLFPVKLSQKEIEVLAAFMAQDKKLIEEDMFNTIVRKKVMKQLNLSPGGLGNHLEKMLTKGFLSKNEITKKITIQKYLLPESNGQGYRLKLVKDVVKE